MALVGDGELAVTKGVPELDGAVTGGGDNLAVVGGERNGENVVGVADESPGGLTSGELPQAEGLVPGGGQSVGTVGGDHLYNPHERSAKSILPLMLFPVPPSRRSRSGFVLRCGDDSFFLVWTGTWWGRSDSEGIHSQRRCESDPQGCAWGNRRPARRGSGSR